MTAKKCCVLACQPGGTIASKFMKNQADAEWIGTTYVGNEFHACDKCKKNFKPETGIQWRPIYSVEDLF